MLRRVLALLCLALLAGCAKPDLPATPVRAGSADELAAFRADLADRFPADQLRNFDTALKEIQLDAMNRGVATAAEREQAMLKAVHGQTVRAAEILGWRARQSRIELEIRQMTELLEGDLALERRAGPAGPSAAVRTRLENERAILARLNADLAAARAQLAAWTGGA